MKKVFQIIPLIILITSFTPTYKTLLEKITVGRFSYTIYKERKYLHDDDINADFFVVYGRDKKNNLCGSFMYAMVNDTLLIKGHYLYSQKRLEFREYYFNNKSRPDSIIKIFYPNKSGKLIMTKYIEFKNGKGIEK